MLNNRFATEYTLVEKKKEDRNTLQIFYFKSTTEFIEFSISTIGNAFSSLHYIKHLEKNYVILFLLCSTFICATKKMHLHNVS